MDKQQLIEQMKTVLASVFSFYLKAQNYHWNVTGPNFEQYHSFLGTVYSDAWESVDAYAEHIRALDAFAPGSLKRFSELSRISDEIAVPSAKFMFIRLAADNEVLLDELRSAANMAEEMKERGVLNFLEGQIDAHEKLQWKLKSFEEK
jgi:starvation-inducible DNA-binding protein